jgi:hypothetical protein
MIVLAIDPATRTGWCLGAVGGKPRLGTEVFGGQVRDDHADIFARALHWIDVQLSSDASIDEAYKKMPAASAPLWSVFSSPHSS